MVFSLTSYVSILVLKMNANVPQIWLSAAHLPEGFCVPYVSFSTQFSKRPLTGCGP